MAYGYSATFYLLSLVWRGMTVGIAQAIWSGVGIVLLALMGAITFQEMSDTPAGIALPE